VNQVSEAVLTLRASTLPSQARLSHSRGRGQGFVDPKDCRISPRGYARAAARLRSPQQIRQVTVAAAHGLVPVAHWSAAPSRGTCPSRACDSGRRTPLPLLAS